MGRDGTYWLTFLSKEDIDDIIVKAVTAAVSAVKKELTDILYSKLDGVLKDIKDEEILQLQQEKNCGYMSTD